MFLKKKTSNFNLKLFFNQTLKSLIIYYILQLFNQIFAALTFLVDLRLHQRYFIHRLGLHKLIVVVLVIVIINSLYRGVSSALIIKQRRKKLLIINIFSILDRTPIIFLVFVDHVRDLSFRGQLVIWQLSWVRLCRTIILESLRGGWVIQ